MSGEIGVNSRPGVGSTFWFTVPLSKDEAWSHKQHSPLLTDSNGAIQPRSGDTRQKPAAIARESDALRILVAEDNRMNQAVLEGMLHALGHTTWVAGTGCEALAAFQSQEFDVVLMDCLMPVMDGFEATCNIRKWEEQHNQAPTLIVAVTANARQKDREHCLAMGMDDFLSKPYTIKQLTQALEQKTSTQSAPTGVIEAQNSVTSGENEKPELKAFEAPSMFAVDVAG
jgi:CheY-like chemotaxis protein